MRTSEIERRLENLFSSPPEHGREEAAIPLPLAKGPPSTIPIARDVIRPNQPPDGELTFGMVEMARALALAAPTAAAGESISEGASVEPHLFKTILDQIPDPVFIKDRDHRWVVVNSAFCRLIGQSEDELLGRTDHDYFPQVSADEAWERDDRVFDTRQPESVERAIESEEGTVRLWRVTRQPLPGANGATQFLVGTVQDINDRRQAEIALRDNEAKYQAERRQWEEKFRKLRRGLLFQFGAVGVVATLGVSVFVAAGEPGQVAADAIDTPDRVAAATLTPTATKVAVTPSPQATATSTSIPTVTPTPTVPPLVVTAAATIAPLIGGEGYAAAPTPAPLREFGPNVINIVLMGSDRRPGDGAWRTDVVILVSVDPDVPSVTMLSFPRDLWVYIPGWRWQRINLADGHGESGGFPGGGPALIKQTIQYNFGIPVHYYARVDFTGYKGLVDSVGGVDVVADCTLYDIFPDVPDGANDIISGPELSTVLTGTIDIPVAGVYHLDGKHALWYSRSRKTTSDFDRSRRQQRVLRALWNEIREQGLLSQVPQLWDTFTRSVETDLSLNDVLYLADVGTRLRPAQIRSRFVDGSMLTWFVTETGANVLRYHFDEILPYLDETFAPLPKNIAAQAPALVDVLNHSGHADWEFVAADRLGWSGYSVSSWQSEGAVDAHTSIIDYTSTAKGSRLEALAELFQVAPEDILRQPNPQSAVAYRVIVGQDFEPCQRPSPGRWPAPPPAPAATPEAAPAVPGAVLPPP